MTWRVIPDCSEGYLVSDTGRVWSTRRGIERVQASDTHGYRKVTLPVGGRWRPVRVHQIVAHTFFGPPPRGMEVRHLDGDKANNAVSNLAYGTKKENRADQDRHGTAARGERHSSAKLNCAAVAEIRRLKGFVGIVALAARFGVSHQLVSRVQRGEVWKETTNGK